MTKQKHDFSFYKTSPLYHIGILDTVTMVRNRVIRDTDFVKSKIALLNKHKFKNPPKRK